MTLDDLIELCAERNPQEDDVHSLLAATGSIPERAFGVIAVAVARRYMSGAVAFDVADAVMNALFAYATRVLGQWPEPMYSVYLAFDSGEYHHRGDASGTNPEQKYIRPSLAAILRDIDVA